jgi:hypothetical protein
LGRLFVVFVPWSLPRQKPTRRRRPRSTSSARPVSQRLDSWSVVGGRFR